MRSRPHEWRSVQSTRRPRRVLSMSCPAGIVDAPRQRGSSLVAARVGDDEAGQVLAAEHFADPLLQGVEPDAAGLDELLELAKLDLGLGERDLDAALLTCEQLLALDHDERSVQVARPWCAAAPRVRP